MYPDTDKSTQKGFRLALGGILGVGVGCCLLPIALILLFAVANAISKVLLPYMP
jgi:hypothetical protein